MDIEPTDDHVQVAKQLADPEVKLFCHFVAYAMKPINKDSIQTHASCVGTLIIRSVVHKLLRVLLTNFIEPKVLQSTDDILSISYQDWSQQVKMMSFALFLGVCESLWDKCYKDASKISFFGQYFEDLAFLDPIIV